MTTGLPGDNKTENGYYNAPLDKDGHYIFWLGLAVSVDGETQAAYTRVAATFKRESAAE